MPYVTLAMKQFRSYRDFSVALSPSVTIVVGPNGSGKTNLLEALYVLSQGTSFRVSDRDLVQSSESWLRIDGRYDDQQRSVTYDTQKTPPKQFIIDGVKKQRLSAGLKVPLVLFEPNELRLLTGSPQRRREYCDGLISRLWPDASLRRSRFERALLQRNNVIRQTPQRSLLQLEDELFVWDIKLAEYATALVERRLQLLQAWNERLSSVYSAIAGSAHRVHVVYQSEMRLDAYKADLLHRLTTRRQSDIVRGFTTTGPHRDDVVIEINGIDAATTASRGETRTLVLALKIIELELLAANQDRRPILLLDDVFSELDATRRQALAEQARHFQTIITTTDADSTAHYFADYALIAPAGK